jgi:hypothetical protein
MLPLSLLLSCSGMDFSSKPIEAVCDGVQQANEESVDAPFDLDGDGYFDGVNPDCLETYTRVRVDCDDTNPDVHPSVDEVCDGIDNDCDRMIDEAEAIDAVRWAPDADGDGYGDWAAAVLSCEPVDGMIPNDGDCDDTNDAIHPGAEEICDEVDDDCDQLIDEDAVCA